MAKAAFLETPSSIGTTVGRVMFVGESTVTVLLTGRTQLVRNVPVAAPLTAKDIHRNDRVLLTWVDAHGTWYVTGIIEWSGARDAATAKRPEPPTPKELAIKQTHRGTYFVWEFGGTPAERMDLDTYQVDARRIGHAWGYGPYPVLEASKEHLSLFPAMKLQVRVREIDRWGNFSPWSVCPELLVDTMAPVPPMNLTIESVADGLRIAWTGPKKSGTPDLDSFMLYVADDEYATGGYDFVASTTASSSHVFISMTPGRPRYFNLTSVDLAGNESDFAASPWIRGFARRKKGVQMAYNADWERKVGSYPDFWWVEDWFQSNPYSSWSYGDFGLGGGKGIKVTFGPYLDTVPSGEVQTCDIVFGPDYVAPITLAAKEGHRFTASVFVKPSYGTDFLQSLDPALIGQDLYSVITPQVFWYKTGESEIYATEVGEVIEDDVGDGWIRLSQQVTTPAGADGYHPAMRITMSIGAPQASTTNFSFDRPMLEQGWGPSDWTPGLIPSFGSPPQGLLIDIAGIKTADGTMWLDATGKFRSSLVPTTDNSTDLGHLESRWRNAILERLLVTDGVSATGVGTGWAQLYVDTADGHLKVKHGTDTAIDLEAGTGTHSLTDGAVHTDVNVGSLSNGDALVWNTGTSKWVNEQPGTGSHVLATTSGLGTYHTVSGLTAGQVLRATGATTAAFQQLSHTDLGSVSADQHHAGFVGLEDTSATAVTPAADDRIQLTSANNILSIVAGTNILTFTINQANISHDSIADVSANDHHNQQHTLSGTDHTGDLAWTQIDSLIAAPTISLGTAYAEGSAQTMIRSDATLVVFDTTLPTTIAAGTSSSATGSASVAARRDHTHGIGTAAPSTNLSVSSSNTEGTGTSFSRATHVHAIDSSNSPGATASILATTAAGLLTLQHLTVSGNFSVGKVDSHLIPLLTDTYDLGSSTLLWRKGWLSEMEAILFVENTASVMGGWFIVPHSSGTLAEDVDDTETDIDFGSSLTVNDFILLRGNNQVEYMQVTAFVSGTIYTVTRNLDGSGANAWPQGHVWVNLGYDGDGRVELDAQTGGPRISMIRQGTSYNQQTELVRLGDLNGWGPYSTETWGMAIGNYSGGDYLKYDPTNGLVIAGDGSGVTNINGGNIQTGTVDTDQLTADAVTAEKIDVTNLAAVSASTGALTVDNTLTMSTGAVLKCGATAYDSGTGYWLEYNAGTPRLFLGNASAGKLLWDGSGLKIYSTTSAYIDLSGTTISLYNNSVATLVLQADGDVRFGEYNASKANLFWDADPGDLLLRKGGTDIIKLEGLTGDAIFGQTGSGHANMWWDADGGGSTGQLKFRAGTGTVQLYIDTDGSLVCGAGAIELNALGLTFATGTARANKVTWYDGATYYGGIWTAYGSSIADLYLESTLTTGDARVFLRAVSGATSNYLQIESGTTDRITLWVGASDVLAVEQTTIKIHTATDLYAGAGLRVGDTTNDPPDNDVTIAGGLTVGGTTDPAQGYALVQAGLRVGSLGAGYDNDIILNGGIYAGATDVDPDAGMVQSNVGMSGWFPFGNYALVAYQMTTNGGRPYAGTISRDMTIRSWHQAVWVDTTNNASNYWTINLKNGSGTNRLSFDTSAMSADAWNMYSSTGLSTSLTAASEFMLYVQVAKTGSPGAISLPCPAIFVT